MRTTEWQIRVRGSEVEWRDVSDSAEEVASLLRDYPELFVAARFREVGDWQTFTPEDS